MTRRTGRFEWIAKLARIWLIGAMVLAGLALVATVGKTVAVAMESPTWTSLAPWVLAIVAEILMVEWVFVIYGMVAVLISNEQAVNQGAGRLARVEALLENISSSSKRLIELGSVSDQSKGLIFREREMEAIREVIHEDLMRRDYKAAEALIDGIEKKFGYADEAARLRKELEAGREATVEENIDAAIDRVRVVIERRDWARATRETQRLLRMFPDNVKVKAMPQRIVSARTEHKRKLLQAYDDAVRKNDVELGVSLLKELDQYLAPQEAAALAESARGVFRAKLHNLGVQFAMLVTDQQWAKAVATGEEIVRDFPNSRMSHEVQAKMDQLRSLAAAVVSNN